MVTYSLVVNLSGIYKGTPIFGRPLSFSVRRSFTFLVIPNADETTEVGGRCAGLHDSLESLSILFPAGRGDSTLFRKHVTRLPTDESTRLATAGRVFSEIGCVSCTYHGGQIRERDGDCFTDPVALPDSGGQLAVWMHGLLKAAESATTTAAYLDKRDRRSNLECIAHACCQLACPEATDGRRQSQSSGRAETGKSLLGRRGSGGQLGETGRGNGRRRLGTTGSRGRPFPLFFPSWLETKSLCHSS